MVGYLGLSAQVWSVVGLQEVGEAPRQGRRHSHSARNRTQQQPVVLRQLGPGETLVDASNLKYLVLCVRFVSS